MAAFIWERFPDSAGMTRKVTLSGHWNSLSHIFIYDMVEDQHGDMWLASKGTAFGVTTAKPVNCTTIATTQ